MWHIYYPHCLRPALRFPPMHDILAFSDVLVPKSSLPRRSIQFLTLLLQNIHDGFSYFSPNHSGNHSLPVHAFGECYTSLKTGKKTSKNQPFFSLIFAQVSLLTLTTNILWSSLTFSSLFLTQLVGVILHQYYALDGIIFFPRDLPILT